ncbi:M13-type metalloendopeptidase [Paenibacillus arenosi]|uniref:S-layer homology domain-containing protein n=1 Tax=Paenibacillus arenosi TaxID=2774142 RepID=A0ABR9AUZ8_9BACL|nr:M13-type metalloendopeptidase [Paenibacillus arenosi]MBD8497910.1 S-layer homology domain-containing protein [Paenibacillus arenosi]
MKKKIVSLLLALSMALSFHVSVYADTTPQPVTRGDIVNSLLTAADTYKPGLTKEAIIQGYKNKKLNENEPVKKIEALVMLSRAFGQLPEPVGNDLRIGTFGLTFTDVPAWAKKDIDKLVKAGVLTAKPEGTLGANDPITSAEFQTIINRVWALKGNHLKDDFYEAVNKKWLNQSTIPAGEMMGGVISELHHVNNKKIAAIMEELISKQLASGTKERKLADFHNMALDKEKRNKLGIEPIKKYVTSIDEAKTINELVQADLNIDKDLGFSTLFKFDVIGDVKNSNKNDLYYRGLKTGLDKSSFATEDANAKKAYIEQITKYLVLTGENSSTAKARAEKVYEMEKSLAAVSLERYEQGDVSKIYNPYTIEKFDDLYKIVDMKQVLTSMKLGHADKIIVMDEKLAQKGAAFMTEANLDVLKAYVKVQLLEEAGQLLSDEIRNVSSDFYAAMYGVSKQNTDKEAAQNITSAAMGPYLEQMFAEKHFSPKAKKDVEQMVEKMVAVYEKRINALDWMSETTKMQATKKLKAINVKVGYPDKWETTLDKVTFKTYDEGGSLFSNYYAATKVIMDEKKASVGQPVDKQKWTTSVHTANAFYNVFSNEMTFPAGILQAPFYDVNAKPEQNLGAIGTLIGHEISHAFDDEGAAFDEQGNEKNWWTEEDLKKFQEKCKEVIAFYNGIEAIPGVISNGQLTLGENVADLGGMAVALQVVSEMSKPDYKAFFESNATTARSTITKEVAAYLSSAASHSLDKIRVNRTVVNFQEFYDTYGIKPGDGMYVAPENRVSIW